MSFASETKNELCKTQPQLCCQKAECYGLLLFGRSFSKNSVTLITESKAAARRAAQFTAQITGAATDMASSIIHRKGTQSVFTVSVPGDNQIEAVLNKMGHTGREINLRINYGNIENDCCRSAFLRGAFLSCGTVTDPKKDYHLEFVVPHMNLAKDLSAFIRGIYELDLEPKLTSRKGAYVVYVKGSGHVSDLLAFMGAGNAVMEIIQAKMLKEVRNDVNRKINFETANLDKTVSAAARQKNAIEKIMKKTGVSALPEELREIAALRYSNPELSLRSLAKACHRRLAVPG